MSDYVAVVRFADQAFRSALRQPVHLRAFLRRVIPDIADRLDFEQARYADPELPFDDWRGRHCDLLVEIPCRTEGGATESILVCVLIEHQSRGDPRMPLRTLIYSTLYWDRQWREWEARDAGKPPFRLRPLLPVVLCADEKPWGTARRLADLFEPDNPFPDFIPRWEPLFWELSSANSDELLNSTEAFDQFLAVVRAGESEADEFGEVFRRALEQLQERHAEQRVVLSDMLRLVFTWAMWRRPPREQARWNELTTQTVRDAETRRELENMNKPAIQELYEETIRIEKERGREEGREEGLEKGRLAAMRESIIRIGRLRFKSPNSRVEEAVMAEASLERLGNMHDRAISAPGWEEILAD